MCSSLSPTEVLAPRVGELWAAGTGRRGGPGGGGHLPGPAIGSGAEIAAGGPEAAAAGAVRAPVGWDAEGRGWGRGRRAPPGGGGGRGRARTRRAEHAEVITVQRAARRPEARAPLLLRGDCAGPAGASPPPGEALVPRSARLLAKDPAGHAPTSARAPRGSGSRRPDSHKLPPARPPLCGHCSPRASYLPARRLWLPLLRAPGSGPAVQRARRLRAVRAAGARL